MTTSFTVETGATLYDHGGSKVGTVTDVLRDQLTLEPEWYEVKTGVLGGHHLVPAENLTEEENRYVVPFDKEQVKSAPKVDRPPLQSDRALLREHYRVP